MWHKIRGDDRPAQVVGKYWSQSRRAREIFVDRIDEVREFERTMQSSTPTHLIHEVLGPAGVGKTTLLARFGQVVGNAGGIVASVDETQRSVEEVLDKLGSDLVSAGVPLDRYLVMRQSIANARTTLRGDATYQAARRQASGRAYSDGGLGRSIFISYSHEDSSEVDALCTHLGALEGMGRIKVWSDRTIRPGDDWQRQIEEAIDAAAIAILVVTAPFLSSKFIREWELPLLMAQREERGLVIFPIIARACAWKQTPLAALEVRPKDGSIWPGNADAHLAVIAGEVNERLLEHTGTLADPSFASTASPDCIVDRNPVWNAAGTLTEALVHDIATEAQRRTILLSFDAWEVLAPFADAWLTETLLEGLIEMVDGGVFVAVAGQARLSHRWDALRNLVRTYEVQSFEPEVANEYLVARGITDEVIRRQVVESSDGLPLMLSILGNSRANYLTALAAGRDVVDRVLRRFDLGQRMQVLTCAQPRHFDQSVIARLVPGVEGLFEWLGMQAFVQHDQGGRWRYHPMLRALMLRYLFDRHRLEYQRVHRELVAYYAELIDGLRIVSESNELGWRLRLEWLAHHLHLGGGMTEMLATFLQTFRRSERAQHAIDVLLSVSRDMDGRTGLDDWARCFAAAPPARTDYDCADPGWLPTFQKLAQTDLVTSRTQRAFVSYECGYFLWTNGENAAAEQAFRAAVALDPEYVSARASLGRLLLDVGADVEAEQMLLECVRMAPNYVYAHYYLAQLYERANRVDDAERCLRAAADCQIQVPYTCFNHGNLLRRQGRFKDSVAFYRKAIELSPHFTDAARNLALATIEGGLGRDAIADALAICRQVDRLAPPDVGFRVAAADLSEALGDYPQAIWWRNAAERSRDER